MIRTAILMVSSTGVGAGSEDRTAQAIRQVLKGGPFVEVDYQAVPDEQALIRAKLRVWSDVGEIDLILTTGGVGLGQRDRTPEATAEVIEREVRGLPEAMRAAVAKEQPLGVLSRALAGVRRGTLIVNLPGTPTAAGTALAGVVTALAFAVEEIRGERITPPAS
ncbi:MAG TPA: MogA/MoaB family molybdenum cofactor biosynthesis protein [Trueperaceae bacterium]|nr:MogA/MoaB family molybdenum cofactor biosynthesis protein [Trueperaceae bacterium]